MMSRSRLLLIMALVGLEGFAASAVVADAAVPVPVLPGDLGIGTYRAVLIGVQDYDATGKPDLATPDRDVAALSDLLASQYRFTVMRGLVEARRVYPAATGRLITATVTGLPASVPEGVLVQTGWGWMVGHDRYHSARHACL